MKKRILVIDDDWDLLAAIKENLQSHHFSCSTISSPDVGFEEALRWRPHLILLDLVLPKMSGLGFLREIKNNPALRHIPVIILSGISDEEVVREGIDLGATAYLSKTCGTKEFATTLEEYLDEGIHGRKHHDPGERDQYSHCG